MKTPEVSIIIPHYQTADLARLCLRSIRKYTTAAACEVIVVDNGSQDGESLDYLRSVKWIRLIERTQGISDVPAEAHKQALDIGIGEARGKYVLSFHTDTIATSPAWCEWLISRIELSDKIAAVGTYKLERKPLKTIEHWFKKLVGKKEEQNNLPYIRSHCAMYRKDVLTKLNLRFTDEVGKTTGQGIHFTLIENGYRTELLSVSQMLRHVVHLNHGTMVMIPKLGARSSTIRKGKSRIEKFLSRADVRRIYYDESLDR